MLDFEEELKKFRPSPEIDQVAFPSWTGFHTWFPAPVQSHPLSTPSPFEQYHSHDLPAEGTKEYKSLFPS